MPLNMGCSVIEWHLCGYVGDNDSVFMIFAGVRMGPNKTIWYPNQNEKFIGLNGCEFFRHMNKNEELWLTKVKLGTGSRGEALVLASGQNRDPKGILGWSGDASDVFAEKLDRDMFGSVALIGVVADMTKFTPARECDGDNGGQESFCQKTRDERSGYRAELFDEEKYKREKSEFGDWLELSENGLEEIASTGQGWVDLRNKVMNSGFGEGVERGKGWSKTTFKNWVNSQFTKGHWFPLQKNESWGVYEILREGAQQRIY